MSEFLWHELEPCTAAGFYRLSKINKDFWCHDSYRFNRYSAVWASTCSPVWRVDHCMCSLLPCTIIVENFARNVLLLETPRGVSNALAPCQRCIYYSAFEKLVWYIPTHNCGTRYGHFAINCQLVKFVMINMTAEAVFHLLILPWFFGRLLLILVYN